MSDDGTVTSDNKVPWYKDTNVILKIIILLGVIVNYLQSLHNGSKTEAVDRKVDEKASIVIDHQEKNTEKIDTIHKEVKQQSLKMGMKPPEIP